LGNSQLRALSSRQRTLDKEGYVRSVSFRVALSVFILIAAHVALADDPPNPFDPPEARVRPPIGQTSQARIRPPGGVSSDALIRPPIGTPQPTALIHPPIGQPEPQPTIFQVALRWVQLGISIALK
jgi:hypothetical protein